jgi:hypothetical protein
MFQIHRCALCIVADFKGSLSFIDIKYNTCRTTVSTGIWIIWQKSLEWILSRYMRPGLAPQLWCALTRVADRALVWAITSCSMCCRRYRMSCRALDVCVMDNVIQVIYVLITRAHADNLWTFSVSQQCLCTYAPQSTGQKGHRTRLPKDKRA